MLKMIGLKDSFDEFKGYADRLFSDLVEELPVFSNGKLMANSHHSLFKDSAFAGQFSYSITQSGKSTLISYIEKLSRALNGAINIVAYNNPELEEFIDVSPRYFVKDRQKTPIASSLHTPSLAFYFESEFSLGYQVVDLVLDVNIDPTPNQVPDETLGRLADYGNALWMAQPTRTFAPVFYLHGPCLTLILFYRDGWYKIDLGNICLVNQAPAQSELDLTKFSLQKFLFLVNLPLERFGHICGVSESVSELLFASRTTGDTNATSESVLKTASTRSLANSECVKIVSPIQLPISIHGRSAYLYNVEHNGGQAVLKMTWSPTNRLLEGAVYDLLHAHRVRHVPEVFDSGILVENLNGYRLEYLVIENCGQTIDDLIRSLPVGVDHGQIVRSLVEQVTECIISALAPGILHCGISSGHIAIKDGEAFVIDWGHANIANCNVGGASENAVLWRFNSEDVEYKLYDALTGDLSYASIGVLSLIPRRSVFDDIESLFYVILEAYSAKTRDGQEPVGFRFYDSTNFACTRAACLGTNNWRKHFGFTCAGAGVVDILEAMHNFLVVQDDVYVGMRLFSEHKFERLFDTQSAKLFMNQTTVDIFDEANQLDDTMEALQIVSDNDSSSVHTCNEHDGEPTL